ncbi:HAD superfamily hydrolase-like (type 3), putative fragment [Alteracholeplasma palmae J233]|uniref:HAD superfamily hydrolase-like (Type 3), putative n=1 Tax=Alteracholeplasma palmae (strain ATCC 49389 / J233) TaxID=1318466 RepID=U4KKC0_ALTPJ|nr:HAD hydrolase family protein [Alteracholeplasma palmae]CCV64022.1 HAD superfamily hydrolase-like (type 3), putative fragment [Alteracholeplasma palmae J233]
MKRIIFFDVDNTILSSKQKQILPQTRKLLLELANDKDVILGFATGRGPSKVDILGDMAPYFKYRILVNGAVTMDQDKIVFEEFIDAKDVERIVKKH